MTPEEKAEAVLKELAGYRGGGSIRVLIAKAIREAVVEEREAVIKLVDEYEGEVGGQRPDAVGGILRAIRERK
jgi:hypothetical protein